MTIVKQTVLQFACDLHDNPTAKPTPNLSSLFHQQEFRPYTSEKHARKEGWIMIGNYICEGKEDNQIPADKSRTLQICPECVSRIKKELEFK